MFAATTQVFNVDAGSFLAIVATAAIAGTLSAVAGARGVFVPVVVVELALGVVIGPQLLDLAHVNSFTEFFADLGLGMLFFFAGYEIDIERIRGEPLRLALVGWALSLVIAYSLGGILAAFGVVLSLVYVGSALATTAIGTLIPVLSDTGELKTDFGRYLLAAGAVGEFGPILLLTLVLSTQSAVHNALILVAFVALAVGVAVLAVRSAGRTVPMLERTIETQLAARGALDRRARVRAGAARLRARPGPAPRRVRRRPDHPADPPGAGGAAVRLEAHRRRVRRLHPVLLRRERHAPRRGRAVRERGERREDGDLLRAVPGRPRHAGDAPVPARAPAPAGPRSAGAVHGDAAPAGGRDHHRRRRRRPHALLDGGRPGRRRRAVDARRAAARPAHAPHRGGAARRRQAAEDQQVTA